MRIGIGQLVSNPFAPVIPIPGASTWSFIPGCVQGTEKECRTSSVSSTPVATTPVSQPQTQSAAQASSQPPANVTVMPNTAPSPVPAPTKLTPQSLVQPLPDVTAIFNPLPVPCSSWQELNAAIEQNPVIAVAVLAGLYLLLRKRGR